MWGMLFLLFVQSLLQFGTKEGKWEGYYGEKNQYLDMPFQGSSPGLLAKLQRNVSSNISFFLPQWSKTSFELYSSMARALGL